MDRIVGFYSSNRITVMRVTGPKDKEDVELLYSAQNIQNPVELCSQKVASLAQQYGVTNGGSKFANMGGGDTR